MRIFLLGLIQAALFSACHYKTSNPEMIRHATPSIQTLNKIGRDIETACQVTYERANLVSSRKQVFYCYEFSTSDETSLNQAKVIALNIVNGIVERLTADPGIQERVTDLSRRDENIRSRIQIAFVFPSKEGILNATEPLKVFYIFDGNCFYAMCPDNIGLTGPFFRIGSYADCQKTQNEHLL